MHFVIIPDTRNCHITIDNSGIAQYPDYTRIRAKLAPIAVVIKPKIRPKNFVTIQYNGAMSSDSDNLETDNFLFQQAMSDVRPIKQNKHIQPHQQKPPPHPRQREQDDQQVLRDMMSDPVDLADIEIGDELLFTRNGVQHKTFKKLRRGEYAIEAELDLHGKTIEQARVAIADFLLSCQQQGLRCVRIIHGKGHGSVNKQPVLKTYVNHWLRQRDNVLAFCSCRPADGGSGAIYVLLRKN